MIIAMTVIALGTAACSSPDPVTAGPTTIDGPVDASPTTTVGPVDASPTTTDAPAASGPEITLPEPRPASAEVLLNEEASATAVIGTDGGTLEASGADGNSYRLTIPPNALASDIEITMTPITDLTSPAVSEFLGGVQFGPDGLFLLQPASLEISGMTFPEETMIFAYDGNGEDLTLGLATTTNGTVIMPVYHFSGAGTATPDPDSDEHISSNSYRATFSILQKAYVENEFNCVELSSPEGAFLTPWYAGMFVFRVLPGLESAKANDLVLSDGIGEWIEWIQAFHVFEQFVCPDLLNTLDPLDVGASKPARDIAADLLALGLENAIETAATSCRTTHDLGETRYMFDWAGVGHLVRTIHEDIVPTKHGDWSGLATERVDQCMTFEVQFQSLITGSGSEGSIELFSRSTVEGVVPASIQDVLHNQQADWDQGAMTYSPTMDVPAYEACPIIFTDARLDNLTILLPHVDVIAPVRQVTVFQHPPAPDSGEKRENPVLHVLPLTGSEFIDVVASACDDIWGGENVPPFGAEFFNFLHEDELVPDGGYMLIPLTFGNGKLIARATYDRTKSEVGITELTTFDLFHAPRSP